MRARGRRAWRVSLCAALLLGSACGSRGSASGKSVAADSSADRRVPVALPTDAQQAVLEEMRQMLNAMGGAMAAAARDDTTAFFAAIAPARSAAAADPKLEALLPTGWKVLAERTHGGFDQLAASARFAAKRHALRDTTLVGLSRLLAACTACHQSFRVTVQDTRR